MAWEDEFVPMLRDMVGDSGTAQKYTDADLESILVTAAKLINGQALFVNVYVINKDDGTILPDPTSTLDLDNDFSNLIVVRAACILTQGNLIKGAGQAIRIVDNKSEIDLREAFRARLAITEKTWCAQYALDLANYKKRIASGEITGVNSGVGSSGRQVTTAFGMFGERIR